MESEVRTSCPPNTNPNPKTGGCFSGGGRDTPRIDPGQRYDSAPEKLYDSVSEKFRSNEIYFRIYSETPYLCLFLTKQNPKYPLASDFSKSGIYVVNFFRQRSSDCYDYFKDYGGDVDRPVRTSSTRHVRRLFFRSQDRLGYIEKEVS